jgi:hypothetical protein
MLRLTRDLPKPSRVEFGGGAYAMVRPATSLDYEMARQKAQGMAAAVATSAEAADLFGHLTGRPLAPDFGVEELIGAAHTMSLLFLACECITEIHGVAVEDDALAAPLQPEHAALLVRDVQIANALEEKIFARVALEANEGKRIAALARWRAGGGRSYCRGCRDAGEPCASGRPGRDGEHCPEVRHRPLTREGTWVADVLDRPGVWQRAGMAGTVTGLSLPEALAALPAGLDRDFAILLLGRGENAMVATLAEAAAEQAPPTPAAPQR